MNSITETSVPLAGTCTNRVGTGRAKEVKSERKEETLENYNILIKPSLLVYLVIQGDY